MVGLKRHTVEVVESHPSWGRLADEVCTFIRRICGDLVIDVQHIGSTSVPGLPAKPILDVAVGATNLDVIPELVARLTDNGFIYRGDAGENGGHLFVKESEPDIRSAHVHVVTWNGVQWHNYLSFRNVLRKDARIRKQYADLKLRLCDKFGNDRESYTASKHDFIRNTLSKIGAQQDVEPDALTGAD